MYKFSKRRELITRVRTSLSNFRANRLRTSIRIAFAWTSILLLITILSFTIIMLVNTSGPNYIFPVRPFNDLTKSGYDIRLDSSKNIFQTGILLIAGLWGLIIAKKNEASILFSDFPEIIMTISATILYCLSFVYHIIFLNRVTEFYLEAGIIADSEQKTSPNSGQTIPDIFHFSTNYMFTAQYLFLVSAALITLFAFISAHHLKNSN